MVLSFFVDGEECMILHFLLSVTCLFCVGVKKMIFVARVDFLLFFRTLVSVIRLVSSWRTCSIK